MNAPVEFTPWLLSASLLIVGFLGKIIFDSVVKKFGKVDTLEEKFVTKEQCAKNMASCGEKQTDRGHSQEGQFRDFANIIDTLSNTINGLKDEVVCFRETALGYIDGNDRVLVMLTKTIIEMCKKLDVECDEAKRLYQEMIDHDWMEIKRGRTLNAATRLRKVTEEAL